VFQPNLLENRVPLITGGTGLCGGIALALARHPCE